MHSDYFFSGSMMTPWGVPFGSMLGILFPLMVLDVALRGWGLWRAARMNMNIWFFALLLVNSLGILPAIFLLLTKDEYERTKHGKKKR